MLSATAGKLLNLLFYQIGWFCCVLGAAWGYPLFGAGFASLLILLHLLLAKSRASELRLMLCAGLLGLLVDSSLQAFGLINFAANFSWPLELPLWVLPIWMQFASLFHYVLSWLSGRYWLGALFGLFGGPLAYAAGARLGAAEFPADPLLSLLALALVWALITPLLLWLSQRNGPSAGRYCGLEKR